MTMQLKDERELFLQSFQERFQKEQGSDLISRSRASAWQKLHQIGLPGARNDNFQYIRLKSFFHEKYELPVSSDKIEFEPFEESKKSYVVFVDGTLRLDLSCTEAVPASCVILPLKQAAKTYATLVSNSLSQSIIEEKDPFTLLNIACFQDGLFVYIPPKVMLEAPLQIIYTISDTSTDRVVMPRVHLFMSSRSDLSVVNTFSGDCGSKLFLNSAMDVTVEEGSHLKMMSASMIQSPDVGSHFESLRCRVMRNGSMKSIHLSSSNLLLRQDSKVTLLGQGAEADLSGLKLIDCKKESHTNVSIEHKEARTHSNQFFKGVLLDKSRSSFQGKIYVHTNAEKTEAYQLNNNLLLSDEAEAYSKPNLEIFTDDVKASHGATVGQLNAEELFYLRTRGYSLDEARTLLIKGFCEEVMAKIAVASLKKVLEASVATFLKNK